MFNKQITTQYLGFIKQAGYQYSKDSLGYYLDNGMKKFSIIKTGPTFICYYNLKLDGGWVLQAKSQSILEFSECLRWVLTNIQK